MSDNFLLTHSDHQTSLTCSFKEEKDFCDVTLACEDHQLQAHKVVLKLRSIPSALEIHIRNLCIKY